MNTSVILGIMEAGAGFEFVAEHKFHEKRRWRFDFANLETKTAIEIEGGIFSNGRHTRGKGYMNDMEKYNAAIECGWVVLRYSPAQIWHSETHRQIRDVCLFRLNYKKNENVHI